MAALWEKRFGFQFVAHAIGNANRSGRVERPFHFIENGFPGRARLLSIGEDLDQRAREWSDKAGLGLRKVNISAAGIRRELFAVERLHLEIRRFAVGFRKSTGCISAWST